MQNELGAYLRQQQSEIVSQICTTIVNATKAFPNYSRLKPDVLRERVSNSVATVSAVAENGDMELLRQYAASVTQARLYTGFDPLELLNYVESVAQGFINNISAATFADPTLGRIALRRVRSCLIMTKMQIGSLNMAISTTERLNLDPDIAHASASGTPNSGEDKV